MTQREMNAERVAMRIHRHRMAKHEAIKYEDVKLAYIAGCEDTEKEIKARRENERLERK